MEEDFQLQQIARARARTGRTILLTALLAFALGAVIAAWLGWRGDFDRVLPREAAAAVTFAPVDGVEDAVGQQSSGELRRVTGLEARLAMLEDRFSRLNLQANAASGNAARAEGLLVAFAARRMVNRGQPLGYLGDQLKLRFANAQPRAVNLLVNFARNPVTLDELDTRLDTLAPDLANLPRTTSTWARVQGGLMDFFTVRRELTPAVRPETRIERAKLMLGAGKVDDAVAQVRRLPGAALADAWIADARRYGAAQQALDLIETTAMIDSRRLQDAQGRRVDQQSPLAQPPGPVANEP